MTQVATHEEAPRSQVGQWTLDGDASSVTFRHKTMWSLVTVKGHFADVTGEGAVHGDSALTGSIRISAASIDTGHVKRDKHLRSADFFDTDSHPEIDFIVTSAALAGTDVRVIGSLTVKGITEPLAVTAHVDENAGDIVALTAHAVVDRDHFGVSWNRLGMMRGHTAVTVKAVYQRLAD